MAEDPAARLAELQDEVVRLPKTVAIWPKPWSSRRSNGRPTSTRRVPSRSFQVPAAALRGVNYFRRLKCLSSNVARLGLDQTAAQPAHFT
jgi:hypothetical protein